MASEEPASEPSSAEAPTPAPTLPSESSNPSPEAPRDQAEIPKSEPAAEKNEEKGTESLPPRFAIAKLSRTPEDADDLKFDAGDRIRIVFQEGEGWWQGELNDKIGMFPSSHVEILPDGADRPMPLLQSVQEPSLRLDGLPPDVNVPELQAFLQNYGVMHSCLLDPSLGVVVVQFANPQGTANVLRNRLKFKGRDILPSIVGQAFPYPSPAVKRAGVLLPIPDHVKKLAQGPLEPKLFVQRIGPDTSQETFKKALEEHGEVAECTVVANGGFGFAVYANPAATQAALIAGHIKINGLPAPVTLSKQKTDGPPSRFVPPPGILQRAPLPQMQAGVNAAYPYQQQAHAAYPNMYGQANVQQPYGVQYAQQQYGMVQQQPPQQPQQYAQQAQPQTAPVQPPQYQQQYNPQYIQQQQQQYSQQYAAYQQQQAQAQAQQVQAQQVQVQQVQQTQVPAQYNQWQGQSQQQTQQTPVTQPMIQVSGLPVTLTRPEFDAWLQRFGQASSNFQAGVPYAVVAFATPEATRLFCSMHGQLEINGSKLAIQWYQSPEQQQQQQQVATIQPAAQAGHPQQLATQQPQGNYAAYYGAYAHP